MDQRDHGRRGRRLRPGLRILAGRCALGLPAYRQIGLFEGVRSRFGRTFAGEPDRIASEVAPDDAVRAADTVLFTVPNQLSVAHNARILATIARHIAPAIGWAPAGTGAAA